MLSGKVTHPKAGYLLATVRKQKPSLDPEIGNVSGNSEAALIANWAET